MAKLKSAHYGKDNIRVSKIEHGKNGIHNVTEMTVRVMIEGDFNEIYTDGDNSRLITTDTIKNTVNILAKQNPVTPPELFASIVGTHFITFYPHINKSIVTITVQRWSRMVIDGKPHSHSFLRDGTDTRNLEAEITEGAGISIRSSISGLMVLKSTGSAFHGFIKDEFTTLKETWDRVMSTEIECGWAFKHFAGLEAVKGATDAFDSAYESARDITLKTFAEELSESGQDAIYMMGERILEVVPLVEAVDYTLPNKHFFEIDLSWHNGLKNTGKDAEVQAPQTNPNGLLKCTVTRD